MEGLSQRFIHVEDLLTGFFISTMSYFRQCPIAISVCKTYFTIFYRDLLKVFFLKRSSFNWRIFLTTSSYRRKGPSKDDEIPNDLISIKILSKRLFRVEGLPKVFEKCSLHGGLSKCLVCKKTF